MPPSPVLWRAAEAGLPYTDPFSIFELIHPLGEAGYCWLLVLIC